MLYSKLLHLPPLGFHCVGGCWDRTVATLALVARCSNHSVSSHPQLMNEIKKFCQLGWDLHYRVSQKTKILGAQVFPILLCPKSPNMTIKIFSIIIKRYMSNLEFGNCDSSAIDRRPVCHKIAFKGHSSQKETQNGRRARCQDQAGYYKCSEGVKALSPFIWKASESNGG